LRSAAVMFQRPSTNISAHRWNEIKGGVLAP
jgi:hypothetical protein